MTADRKEALRLMAIDPVQMAEDLVIEGNPQAEYLKGKEGQGGRQGYAPTVKCPRPWQP